MHRSPSPPAPLPGSACTARRPGDRPLCARAGHHVAWTALVLLSALVPVHAQGTAERAAAVPRHQLPVVLIVAAPAGGSLDRLATILTPLFAEALGKPIAIRNDPQAGSAEGLAGVATVHPGEVRIALASNSVVVAARLLGYGADVRPLHDFEWIGVLARYPNAVVVRADHPAETLADWVGWAGKSSRPVRAMAGAPGSMSDLAARLLADKAKVAFVHELSSDPQAGYDALRRGTIDVAIDGLPHALAEAGRGDVRILGVTSPARSPALPLVTAFGESWPGEDFSVLGLVATSAAETP